MQSKDLDREHKGDYSHILKITGVNYRRVGKSCRTPYRSAVTHLPKLSSVQEQSTGHVVDAGAKL